MKNKTEESLQTIFKMLIMHYFQNDYSEDFPFPIITLYLLWDIPKHISLVSSFFWLMHEKSKIEWNLYYLKKHETNLYGKIEIFAIAIQFVYFKFCSCAENFSKISFIQKKKKEVFANNFPKCLSCIAYRMGTLEISLLQFIILFL